MDTDWTEDGWTEVDVVLMEDETAVAVYQRGPLVALHVNSEDDHMGAAIVMDAGAREWFRRAFTKADSQAEVPDGQH